MTGAETVLQPKYIGGEFVKVPQPIYSWRAQNKTQSLYMGKSSAFFQVPQFLRVTYIGGELGIFLGPKVYM